MWKWLRNGGIVAWLAVCLLVGGSLLAGHLLTLPVPERGDPELRAAIAATHTKPGWLVIHVLSQECRCSQRIVAHLLASKRPGITERIVWIGDKPPAAPGFEIERIAPPQLKARYHLEAAPLLVVADPDGEIRYVGGYTDRKQAADIRDLEVIAMAKTQAAVEALPAFGCAVGEALRDQLDPLGVR